MSRKPADKSPKVPRKVAVRRAAVRPHRNKYARKSPLPHDAYGVRRDPE